MLVLENPSSTFHYVSFKIIFSLTILKYLLFSCFLYITPKAQLTKEKVGLHQNYELSCFKGHHQENDGRKNLANHI